MPCCRDGSQRGHGPNNWNVRLPRSARQNGLFASAAFDKDANEVIVKVVNTSKTVQPITLNLKDLAGATTAQTLTLSHKGMDDENSIQHPELITPKQGSVTVQADKKQSVINDQLPAMTFRIYRIKK